MYRRFFMLIAAFCTLALTPFSGFAEEADSIEEMVTKGKVGLSFRYRFENVDQDGFSNDAHASTLRTRLNLKTADFYDIGFLFEVDNVSYIGNDSFNNSRNGNTSRPVVADPDGTDVNQAFVDYSGLDKTNLRYGRQRINRDNQRFVGGVGWRQNEQTYDTVSAGNTSFTDVTLDYAYIYNVNRIWGPDSGTPTKDFDSESHIVNASYSGIDWLKISGYVYLFDFDNADSSSSDTYGIRLTGQAPINDEWTVTYAGEFASQEDAGDNPNSYDADYMLLEGGIKYDKFTALVGLEVLDGSSTPGEAFQTPLATGHKFQGWADKFLTTPTGGIEDTYISLGAELWTAKWGLVFHQFEPETGSGDYGDELDFVVSKKFGKRYSGMLKYAAYDADNFATDTDKVWLMFTAAF